MPTILPTPNEPQLQNKKAHLAARTITHLSHPFFPDLLASAAGGQGRAAGCACLRPRTPAPSPSILLPWRRPSLPSFLLPQRAEVTPTHSYLTFPDPLASATGGKGRAAGRVPGALQPPTPAPPLLPLFPSSPDTRTRCSPSLLSYLCNRRRGAPRTLHPLPASRATTHEPPRGTPTLHGPGPAGIPHPRTAMAMDQIHSCVTPTSGRCSSATKTSSISPPQAQLTSRSWIREWHQEATYYPLPSFSTAKQRKSLLVSTCSSRGISTPPYVMYPRWGGMVMQFGMRSRAGWLWR